MQSDTLNLVQPDRAVADYDWRSFFELARTGAIRMPSDYRGKGVRSGGELFSGSL